MRSPSLVLFLPFSAHAAKGGKVTTGQLQLHAIAAAARPLEPERDEQHEHTGGMPVEESSSLSVLEERIAAEEEVICERVRALERQVQTLHEHKVVVQQARVLAESHQHAEAELKRWEASLFAEVESATCRLNEQRQVAGFSNPSLALASFAPTPTHTWVVDWSGWATGVLQPWT